MILCRNVCRRPVRYGYELSSRGRKQERYPVWKSAAHAEFWSGVDKVRVGKRESAVGVEVTFATLTILNHR